VPETLTNLHFRFGGCLEGMDVLSPLDRKWLLKRNERLICKLGGTHKFCFPGTFKFSSDPTSRPCMGQYNISFITSINTACL